MFGYIFLIVGMILVSMLCVALNKAVKTQSLDRNSAIGLRTKATLASDHAWNVGHQTARPYLLGTAIAGVVGTVVSLTAIPFFIERGSLIKPEVMVIPAFALAVQIIILLWTSKKADTAAKSVMQ